MDDPRRIDSRYRPLGSQSRELTTFSRRKFMTVSVAGPVSMWVASRVSAAAPRPAEDPRFLEDREGLSVLWSEPDPDPQNKKPFLYSWRLNRRAFGPNASFTLRTLRAGKERGYELRIAGVRFGSLDREHWLVFQRIGGSWSVRMRTSLWESQPGKDVPSNDIDFRMLSVRIDLSATDQDDRCADPTRSLSFEVASERINAALAGMLEGYVRVEGRVKMQFDVDCVWRILPSAGGRIVVAPYGVGLSSLELAWCQIISSDEDHCEPNLPEGARPLGKGTRTDTVSIEDDPTFCAGGALNTNVVVRFGGNDSLTGEVTAVVKPNRECIPPPAEGAASEIQAAPAFRYVRQDWKWKPALAHPSGVATISGNWTLRTRLGTRATIPSLPLTNGVLQFGMQDDEPGHPFAASLSGALHTTPHDLSTKIGRLRIRGWADQNDGNSAALPRVSILFNFSPGTRPDGKISPVALIDIPFLLVESDLAPDGSEISRFTFEPTLVTARWRNTRTAIVDATDPSSGSYLWLGSTAALGERPLARIDLTRARLETARAADLLHLAFLFSDLNLEIHDRKSAGARKRVWIRPAAASCRVLNREARNSATGEKDSQLIDARPTLVVEFPPQHVFERAFFKPSSADLPDVKLQAPSFDFPLTQFTPAGRTALEKYRDPASIPTNPAELLERLTALTEASDREIIRRRFSEEKIKAEKANTPELSPPPFQYLAQQLAQAELPPGSDAPRRDQLIYIGPYMGPSGMDPDVAALARRKMQELHDTRIAVMLEQMLKFSADAMEELGKPTPQNKGEPNLLERIGLILKKLIENKEKPETPELALEKELVLGGVLFEYGLYREFYRRTMTELYLGTNKKSAPVGGRPTSLAIADIEYFSSTNRWKDAITGPLDSRDQYVRGLYVEELKGGEALAAVARARLSNPSRLAFRVNCGPAPLAGDRRQTDHADDTIEFSIAGLTDWTKHELAVTSRARAIVSFDEAGRPLPDVVVQGNDPARDDSQSQSGQTVAAEDIAMLRMLGMRSGRYVTAQERLADVEASLRTAPGPLETAIEIPARLILSPSQRAQWRTPRLSQLPFSEQPHASADTLPVPLWNAELAVDNPNPGVRAVHSPDLRPGFVRRGLEKAANRRAPDATVAPFRTPFLGAPPRGPRAPWTLGIEESDPAAVDKFADLLKITGTTQGALDTFEDPACAAPDPKKYSPQRFHPLVEYLHLRKKALEQYGESGLFRSSLDAYDRHELVLLTSAWGLPVRGRREQNGQLIAVSTSSQVEPPDTLRPIDLEAGSALYRPRPLKLRELRLTALGGTFRHETDFVPPAAARHIVYGALHDSLSIERWQHSVVLGRDVFAEVVYKGFLFPIGHRASLIKQTERVFLRLKPEGGPQGSMRAYLRQRMFIRIGQPDKAFPTLGQPNLGRQFPAGIVRILTTTTPDLVDPAQDGDEYKDDLGPAPAPGGRLFAKSPGLVFWPRTARISGAEVRFEALIDSSFIRLPMLFVDNTAANDKDVLADLVKYYQGRPGPDQQDQTSSAFKASEHLRSMDFAGQSHRYCDERKPGSATYKTRYWTLTASGGTVTPAKTGTVPKDTELKVPWEGINTKFEDASLEAVDQPPFYPALEAAWIRMDQVERMTGKPEVLAVVKYDGYFLANGFPAQQGSTSAAGEQPPPAVDRLNPLEIYLNVVNRVIYEMGASGERSGCLLRPAAKVVALSRERGPISGTNQAPPGSQVISLVGFYEGDPEKAPDSTAQQQARVKTYENYFPKHDNDLLNTKLLGIVKISDLIKVLKLKSVQEGLPDLREVVNYGIAGAADAAETVRDKVISPLHKAVAEMKARWTRLNAQLGKSGQSVNKLSMADVFPEVDSALTSFGQALAKSSATAGAAELYTTLAEVYESGRRLVDALGHASANPIERVYVALAQKLQQELSGLQNARADIVKIAKDVFENKLNECTAGFAELVFEKPRDIARFLPIRFNALANPETTQNVLAELLQEFGRQIGAVLAGTSNVKQPDEFVKIVRARTEGLVDWPKDSDPVAMALDPVFRFAASLRAGLLNPLDSAPLASSAHQLLLLLGPLPEARKLGDSGLRTLIFRELVPQLFSKDLDANLNATLKHVAKVKADLETIGAWQPTATKIEFPPGLTTPEDSTLARALYDFANELRNITTSAAQISQELRQFLVKSGNDAIDCLIELLNRAREFAGTYDAFVITAKGKVEEMHFELVEAAFRARAQLQSSIDKALAVVLPEHLPSLQDIGSARDIALGAAVGSVIRKALDAQQSVLEGTDLWFKIWKPVGARLGEERIADMDEAVASTSKAINATIEEARKNYSNWTGWRAARSSLTPLFVPMPGTPLGQAIASFDTEAQRRLRRLWDAVLAVGSKGAANVSLAVGALVIAIKDFYGTLVKVRQEAYDKLSAQLGVLHVQEVLLVHTDGAQLLVKPDNDKDPLSPTNDRLYLDHQSLIELAKKSGADLLDDADRFNYVAQFLRGWARGDASPLRILNQARHLDLEDARARLLSLIDFSSLREEIDERIRQLIPTSASLTYGFQADFSGAPPPGGVFLPQAGCQLTIRSETQLDFRTRSTKFNAVGELGPFDIQLVGDFKALRLLFEGARFDTDGGQVRCDVRYKDFEIQQQLKFLEQLAAFFKPKEGSGFYLVPLSRGIGIESGYGLNLGTISIGNVSIFNASLNAAARLPFDGKPATFLTSLSRRDSPFTISVAPYGGSGFFSLESSAEGITGFEASFEYGGAAAFQYGPLSGYGRLMTGIYIRRSGKESDIGATFYAGGTASIWVFNFGASLYVCAKQTQDGRMVGEATFTFSFSMGIVDFDYRVNVKHENSEWKERGNMQTGGGGRGNARNERSGAHEYLVAGAPPSQRSRRARASVPEQAELRFDTWCQGAHWARHRDYFDLDVDIDVEDFA
jgi:hypothetical protein